MRLTSLAAVAAALATAAPAVGAGDALAASPTQFGYTGAVQTYVVPTNVNALSVTAVGGAGGDAGWAGGSGAVVASTVPVTPGSTLYVYVGGNGAGGPSAPGGFNGGGNASGYIAGASGGGASDIRTVTGDLASRLLVAAGGGGAGSGYDTSAYGGNAGSPDGNAGTGADSYGQPGGGGTQSAGGAGGASGGGGVGAAGTFGQGGNAGLFYYPPYWGGGAGGGGYYGGGGGGGFAAGGGGSDYVVAGGNGTTYGLDATRTPAVTLTPIEAVTAAPSALAFPDTPQQSTSASQTVTFGNEEANPVQVTGVSFSGADPDDYLVSSDTCRGTVAAAGSCELHVKFNPQAQGASSATMTVLATDRDAAELSVDVALSGNGTALPQGPAGADGTDGVDGANGVDGTNGVDGANGTNGVDGKNGTNGVDGKDGVNGTNGTNGLNGKNGKDGQRGRSGATKRGSRARCHVTRYRSGSRVACTFRTRVSRHARVTLRDRGGQVAAALGNGERQMVFVTSRRVRGALSVWVTVGPDLIHRVTRS
jgi:hypothetical protein